MRRLLIVGALVGALLTTAVAVAAGGGKKITEKVIGAGNVAQPYTFQVDGHRDAIVAEATVPPGASFGWHSHRADVVAVVEKGTLTLYDSGDPACTPQRFSAGQGFTEQHDHVHLARNEGRRPVKVLVTYLGLEHGAKPDVPAARPGNCPF